MVIFIAWIAFIFLEQKINLDLMKKYVKINISVKLQWKSIKRKEKREITKI